MRDGRRARNRGCRRGRSRGAPRSGPRASSSRGARRGASVKCALPSLRYAQARILARASAEAPAEHVTSRRAVVVEVTEVDDARSRDRSCRRASRGSRTRSWRRRRCDARHSPGRDGSSGRSASACPRACRSCGCRATRSRSARRDRRSRHRRDPRRRRCRRAARSSPFAASPTSAVASVNHGWPAAGAGVIAGGLHTRGGGDGAASATSATAGSCFELHPEESAGARARRTMPASVRRECRGRMAEAIEHSVTGRGRAPAPQASAQHRGRARSTLACSVLVT